MYKGFKIKITKDSELFDKKFEKYRNIGEKQQNEIQKELKEYEKNLREYIDKETGKINMKKLKNSWFLEIETSIFISHSHLDLDLALAFSGWIKEKYSIDVFLDCYAWGSSDELLKIIDEKYSIKNKDDYGPNIKNQQMYKEMPRSISPCHTLSGKRTDGIERIWQRGRHTWRAFNRCNHPDIRLLFRRNHRYRRTFLNQCKEPERHPFCKLHRL